MVAVFALGAVALTDAFRDRTDAQDGRAASATTTGEREPGATTTTAATTDEVEPSVPRLPGGGASGLLAFTVPGACELRAIDVRSGRMLDLPRLGTNCELWAPRAGSRIAYGTADDEGFSLRRFSVIDLENPQARFGDHVGYVMGWSPDGSTLAWCNGSGSGFELSRGRRPKRLDQCPQAYDASGAPVYVNERNQIVVGGRPLLNARGPVWHLASGVDGSLAVIVAGGRLDRYEDGRLAGTASLLTPLSWPPELAPDNCAALTVSGDVVRVVDLGCFQGQAPRMFQGVYADWSPDGEWIAVAEADAIVLHRVVGPEETVRWDVAAGQLAWLGG